MNCGNRDYCQKKEKNMKTKEVLQSELDEISNEIHKVKQLIEDIHDNCMERELRSRLKELQLTALFYLEMIENTSGEDD